MQDFMDSGLMTAPSSLGVDSITPAETSIASELEMRSSVGTTSSIDPVIPESSVGDPTGTPSLRVESLSVDQIVIESELSPGSSVTELPEEPQTHSPIPDRDPLTGIESDRPLTGTSDLLTSDNTSVNEVSVSPESPSEVSVSTESSLEASVSPESPSEVSLIPATEPIIAPETTANLEIPPSQDSVTIASPKPTESITESSVSDQSVTPEEPESHPSSSELETSETNSQPLSELNPLTSNSELTLEAVSNRSEQFPFSSGFMTVDTTGEIGVKYLFDGGKYKGELAIFSLQGMEQWVENSVDFRREAASRALSNSEQGYVVIRDAIEGAKISGTLEETDRNSGNYLGEKTFSMTPGDTFGFMLVPNGTVRQVYNNPSAEGAIRPLFSLVSANPNSEFHLGQIADVTGEGQILVMEDQRTDGKSDRDYNDMIFQVTGATAQVISLDDAIAPTKEWRNSDVGRNIIAEVIPTTVPSLLDTLPGVVRRSVLRSENLNSYNPISLEETTQWVVGIPLVPGLSSQELVPFFNATDLGATGRIPNSYIWEFDPNLSPAEIQTRLEPIVEFAYPLVPQRLVPQATVNDPLFNNQWHLNNTRQPTTPGSDANVTPAWDILSPITNQPVRGEGVVIGIVDDGLDYGHPDLQDRYRADLSQDFNQSENGNDPSEIYKTTITLDTVPQPLSDNQTTFINLDVAVNGYLTDINVQINIDHNCDSDLDISLVGPTDTPPDPTIGRMPTIPSRIHPGDPGNDLQEVLLVEELEGSNFHNTTFDDQASQSIEDGTAPFTGSFQPQAPLALFNNQRASGWWQLRVTDDTLNETGQLNQLSFEITTINPHGTAVAGIVAATADNNIGVSGVAPEAGLASLRLLANEVTDQLIADALSHESNQIDIYNNSWKPRNWVDGAEILLSNPGALTLEAMINGVEQGRNGLGNIYVFAAGNDAVNAQEQVYSNVNYNGFANSRYAIAVAAIDRYGEKAPYSEPGTPILVSASSGKQGSGITTTDLTENAGYNNTNLSNLDLPNPDYTERLSGTSAAAPIVSGVVALMLEANPNLTWRDVQYILMLSADKNDPNDEDWQQNGAGYWVNHKYGFGAVDAEEAVQLAVNWHSVAPEVSIVSPESRVNQIIPDGSPFGLTDTIQIDEDIQLEKIQIAFDATHPYRGDLKIVLTSPSGTQSILAEEHNLAPDPDLTDNFNPNEDYDQWTFTSVRHWGESSKGTWTLAVYDEAGNQIQGVLNSWQLELFGTALPEVTNTNDSGLGSLRAALEAANNNPDVTTIHFNIPTSDPGYNPATGAFTIRPRSPLPTITQPIIIDGTTQPGFTDHPLIELEGSQAGDADGLKITAGDSTVRGLTINQFINSGIALLGNGNNVIEGNYIGTDVTGTQDRGNGWAGVYVTSSDNLIRNNLLSGNARSGVIINGSGLSATGNVIQGNKIGTDVTGTQDLGNSFWGVEILNSSNNLIGGTTTETGNIIAFNDQNGVIVSNGIGNQILANPIFNNGTGAIELVNANHNLNGLQLTSVNSNGTQPSVNGNFQGTPNQSYRVEFFANPDTDPEGSLFLGFQTITTDSSGSVNFSQSLPNGLEGQFITATITDPDNNTSEFSNAVAVSQPIVTLTTTDSQADESGNAGQFVITRTGNLNLPLTVNYSVLGTATNGIDYTTLPGFITIPAGTASTTLPLIPKSDAGVETDETVQINLIDTSTYNLGTSNSGFVTVADRTGTAQYGPFIYHNPATGNYYLASQPDTWLGAQEQAKALGGNLVTVNNAAENSWLVNTFETNTDHPFWIGYTDSPIYGATEGNFQWINGESSTYTNWTPGAPENAPVHPDGEDFTHIGFNTTGDWNDLPPDYVTLNGVTTPLQYPGIIEIDPANLTQPLVSIRATDSQAAENGNAGQLLVTRIGDTSQPLTVNYSVGGTTINGIDNQLLTGNVTIPAGSFLATIPIIPIPNLQLEATENLTVSLIENNAYNISNQGTTTVQFTDTAMPTPPTIYTNPATGNRYFLTTVVDTWLGTQEQAKAAGGNLVAINDAEENNWLSQTFGANELYWIGLTDSEIYQATEGNFKWVDGEPVTYTNWYITEPNNNYYREDFGQINHEMSGLWNDLPYNSFNLLRGIVELPPEPPLNHWNTRLINRTETNYDARNNYDFSQPDAVLDLGSQNGIWTDGRLSLVRDWGLNPAVGIQDDYFAMESWTRSQFDAGKLYQITSRSDDGVGVRLKNVRTGEWIDNGTWDAWHDNALTPVEMTMIVPETGEYDVYVYYYERSSGAKVDVEIAPIQFNGQVIATIGANIRPNPSTSQPRLGSIDYGETVTFDKWVEGEFVDYMQELGRSSSIWYHIAGSQPDGWVSAAIVEADNSVVPW